MRRVLSALAALYRRWKYVEEDPSPADAPGQGTVPEELARLRRAVAREERVLEDYRRHECHALAREREASLRSLRSRIRALEMNLRRAV
jgi:hypothetical protein